MTRQDILDQLRTEAPDLPLRFRPRDTGRIRLDRAATIGKGVTWTSSSRSKGRLISIASWD